MDSKVPVPPPLASLPVAFPARGDMRPSQQQWIDEVRNLAAATTAAVHVAQKQRKEAVSVHAGVASTIKTHKAAVDKGVDHMSTVLQLSWKRVHAQLTKHEADMALLLQARQKARARLIAAEKPARDMRRRLDFHNSNMPENERQCDTVEADIRASAASLQAAVDELTRQVHLTEQHIAYMQDLRRVLDEESVERQAVQQVNDACNHAEAPHALPKLLPQKSLMTGSSQPASTGKHRVVRQNIERTIELSNLSMEQSAQCREGLRASAKVLDGRVVEAVEAVRKSLNERVRDNKSLQVILKDRLAVSERELDALNDQIAAMEDAAASLERPTAVAQTTRAARKVIAKGLTMVVGDDPVAPATARELGTLSHGAMLHQRQLQALMGQRKKLEELVGRLRGALSSKESLQEVDERLLHIGLTPSAPPTPSLRSSSQRSQSSRVAR